MVGGQGAEARGKGGATEIGELVGVELDRQAELSGRVEHPRHLIGREGDALAEGIDGIREPLVRNRGQDIFHDQRDEGVLVALGLRRQGMGGKTGGAHRRRPFFAEPARGAQRFHLVVEIEPVARLDLDSGDAFRQQGVEPRQRLADQLVLAGGAERPHRRHDAAAGAGDLLIGGARQPHLELRSAVADMDQMGMAVDQSRRDPAAFAIDRLGPARRRGQPGFRSGVQDASAARHDRALLDDAETGLRAGHGRQTRIAPDAHVRSAACQRLRHSLASRLIANMYRHNRERCKQARGSP